MAKINLLALGGLDEKNKNLYVLEIDSKIFILDAGIYEPLRDDFGIQYVIPKLDYLKENVDKVRGIFLSSANKQQIGALSQIIKEIPNLKIYGSDVTIYAIKLLFKNAENWNFTILKSNTEFECAGIKIFAIEMTSSCPGTFGYIFKTNDGNIVYLTDYIFDVIEEFQKKTSIFNIKELLQENNLLLMSDSLNASIETSVSPKYKIAKYIEDSIYEQKSRIVASIYEDEIINIVEILKMAKVAKKKVIFYDERIFHLVKFLIQNEYIEQFNIDVFKSNNEKENAIIIITGTRTDLYSKLQQIVIAEQDLQIDKNDVVFLGSPCQPGNEHIYAEILNDLARIDPIIIETPKGEKYSIHPSMFDLKNFLLLLKPKFFMPIKGYYKEFVSSVKVAKSLNYTDKEIILAENGEIHTIENGINQGVSRTIKDVGASNIQLATDTGIEMEVIKDRENLASEGVLTICFMVDKSTKTIKSNVDIQMRGVIFIKGQEQLMTDLNEIVVETVNSLKNDWILNKIESHINKAISKKLKAMIKKTPYIIIQIYEV